MNVVAFMQNMWVKDPVRVKALIAKYGDNYRLRLIHFALFAGCVSGRRLKAAFGDELCSRITWEESSRVITGRANEAPPADPEHITAVLAHFNPAVVICFGKIAGDAVPRLFRGTTILAPHPAARQPDTVAKLEESARWLSAAIACEGRRRA